MLPKQASLQTSLSSQPAETKQWRKRADGRKSTNDILQAKKFLQSYETKQWSSKRNQEKMVHPIFFLLAAAVAAAFKEGRRSNLLDEEFEGCIS